MPEGSAAPKTQAAPLKYEYIPPINLNSSSNSKPFKNPFKYLLGRLVSLFILPGQLRSAEDQHRKYEPALEDIPREFGVRLTHKSIKKRNEENLRKDNFRWFKDNISREYNGYQMHETQVSIKGTDIVLDGIEISQKEAEPENTYHVIYLCPNGGLYEDILYYTFDEIFSFQNTFQPNPEQPVFFNSIFFNYANVGRSSGTVVTHKDLFLFGIAQVEHLLSRGIDPSKIILKGRSLGGHIAIEVANYFENQSKNLNVFLEFPPASFVDVVQEKLKNFPTLSAFVTKTLELVGFDKNATESFKNLYNKENQKIICLNGIPKKQQTIIKNTFGTTIVGDQVVPEQASFAPFVKPEDDITEENSGSRTYAHQSNSSLFTPLMSLLSNEQKIRLNNIIENQNSTKSLGNSKDSFFSTPRVLHTYLEDDNPNSKISKKTDPHNEISLRNLKVIDNSSITTGEDLFHKFLNNVIQTSSKNFSK